MWVERVLVPCGNAIGLGAMGLGAIRLGAMGWGAIGWGAIGLGAMGWGATGLGAMCGYGGLDFAPRVILDTPDLRTSCTLGVLFLGCFGFLA